MDQPIYYQLNHTKHLFLKQFCYWLQMSNVDSYRPSNGYFIYKIEFKINGFSSKPIINHATKVSLRSDASAELNQVDMDLFLFFALRAI